MDSESPDVIEAELAATRMSLVAKLDAAESKTVGAVKEVISTLEGDAKSVQAAVTDTVGAVREEAVAGLHEMIGQLDPTPYIRRNPWAAVGGSVLGGIVVGLFAFGDRRPRHVTAAAKGTDTRDTLEVGQVPVQSGAFGGFFERIADTLQAELRRAGEEVADTLTSTLKNQISTLKTTVSQQVTEGASHLTEKVTNLIPSMGGSDASATPPSPARPATASNTGYAAG